MAATDRALFAQVQAALLMSPPAQPAGRPADLPSLLPCLARGAITIPDLYWTR